MMFATQEYYYHYCMKESKFKKQLIYISGAALLIIVLATVYLQSLENVYAPPETDATYSQDYVHGEIVKMGEPDDEGNRDLKVRMLAGEEKGKVRDVLFDNFHNYNDYKEGDLITVYESSNAASGDTTYTVADYFHMDGIAYMFIIFVLVALVIAGKKGFRAILSVVASLAFFYFFFIKLIGIGVSPVLAAVLFVFIVSLISIPLIHGLNRKSLASLIAIMVGYAASFGIVYAFSYLGRLGSAPAEEFRLLGVMFENINLFDILIASLFLGAVGALIDTAISISSAIFETLQESPRADFKKVYKVGMNVGKDILGSMINTLLFAYIASSLPFFVMLTLAQESGDGIFYDLMNMDFIALELTRTFVGAVSLVLIIPLVSATSAYYLVKGKN